MDKNLAREVKEGLKDAAEPVRRRAHDLAIDNIRNITTPWSDFRIGATTKVVYLAPRERGLARGFRKRPNLGPLLLDEAMWPALQEEEGEVVHRLEGVLDDLADIWTFHG